jgi:hypothetical protein
MQREEFKEMKLGYNRALATVWAIDRLSPATLTLFRVMSLLKPDRIPEKILTTTGADLKLEKYPRTPLDYYQARAQLLESSLT